MSGHFVIKIEPSAQIDLKIAMDYYEIKQIGLGISFYEKFDKCLAAIEINPFYQIRYKKIIRCLEIPNFPYLIHFHINEAEKMIHILGVLNTYQDPKTSYL